MSDFEQDIDPNLDAEVPEVATDIAKPARNLLNFLGGRPAADTATSGLSEAPHKRTPRQRKPLADGDAKQTRLGAGLRPVKVQPDVPVEEDVDMTAATAGPSQFKSSEQKKPGRKGKKRIVDDEDREIKAMAKAAKQKKPAPKPKATLTKGSKKKDAEGVSDIGDEGETVRGRKTAKRKSTATSASRVSSPHTNSIDTAYPIPDSPDKIMTSKPPVSKRRKLETANDEDSAIVLDTSFDDDDGIEILQKASRSISPDKETRKAASAFSAGQKRNVHPFFGPKLESRGTSATRTESRAESIIDQDDDIPDVQQSHVIHTVPETPKPIRKEAKHPDRATHVFFKFKGKASDEGEAVLGMGRKAVLGEPVAPPLVGKTGWGKGHVESHLCAARFPTQEEQACHMKPPREGDSGMSIRSGGLDMPRRERKRSQTEKSADSSFWQRLYPKEEHTTSRSSTPESTASNGVIANDQAYKETAAVQALSAKNREPAAPHSTRLWTDKYRPTDSSQVLGNEVPSNYLARWMKELALGKEAKHVPGGSEKPSAEVTPKKRKIMRKVKKTRKKKEKEDDWIVDDTLDPIDDYLSADGTDTTGSVTEDENGNAVDISLGPPIYPTFSSRLANSILLQGPHGCGKTAAVYAAAAELGWEVFEVNAGAKRSGAQLSALVGEVGRNHMVGRSAHAAQDPLPAMTVKPSEDSKEPRRNALFQAFAKANGKQSSSSSSKPASSVSTAGRSDDTQSNPFITPSAHDPVIGENGVNPEETANFGFLDGKDDGGSEGRSIRQSLILFEEVDILYEEDQGFWPQVVELIAGSKRPVVMTCNDLGLIPFEKLPLQCTLLFSPPDAPLLRTYLSEINRLEQGDSLPQTYLSGLLKAATYNHPTDTILQQPLAPVTLRQVKGIDLRRSIMQLQLDSRCSVMQSKARVGTGSPQAHSNGVASKTPTWKETRLQMEARSKVDAYLSMSPSMILDNVEIDRYRPSADDEEGMHLVQKPFLSPDLPILPAFSRSDELAQTIWVMSGNLGDMQIEMQDSVSRLARDRENYQLATLPFLDPVIPLESYLLPSPVLFTTYIPAISSMVAIDDTLEQEDAIDAAQGRPRKNRKTGRMMRLTTNVISTPNYVRQMVSSDDIGVKGLQAVRDCRLDFAIFGEGNDAGISHAQSVEDDIQLVE